MQCNVGKGDKIFRILLGIVIIALGLYYHTWWGLIGFIPLLTGVIGWCPLYVPLKISTCKKESTSQD